MIFTKKNNIHFTRQHLLSILIQIISGQDFFYNLLNTYNTLYENL